ncbi:hypothetical protein lerEdw1_018975 [Lerista edwardsae]|nr:hypothetical protein lerEdw1_018975 [Lerista edwardsae]
MEAFRSRDFVTPSASTVAAVSAEAEAMEPFYLYDIIYTKSTERIVSPMVAELYHLIIAIEWDEVNHEALPDLEMTIEELVNATGQLAVIARRLAEESDDEVLKQEMLPASESLLVSGKSILLAAQKLFFHPDAHNCIKEVAASAKRILVETIKVLQTEDNATVRRISQGAGWLLDGLLVLESAQDVSAMLVAFRGFSEALLLLTNLTERFLGDLKESYHQKNLAQTLQLLKKCIPMLYTAKLSNLKHPRDEQVRLSKSYIFDLAESTVKELISLLRKNAGTKKLHERNGLFPQHLHKLLSLLSNLQPIDLHEGKLNFHVEALVFYCMLLADSSRASIKQQLIKLCHHLLKLRKCITVDASAPMEGAPMENQLAESLKEKCCTLRIELENLDVAVRTAILYQILDHFTDIKGPLKRLVEAAVEPCAFARKEGSLRELHPLIAQFFSHSSQMIKTTRLVLVACTEMKTIQEIEECIDHLTRLLATVPALLSEITCSPGDSCTSEKLYLLSQTWSSTTESLLRSLDTVIDPREFLDLAVQEMVGHKEGSEKALENQHSGEFSWHVSSLSKRAIQIVEFISRHVNRTRDPIFRNGLLVLIKQLEDAIRRVKISTDQCVATIANQQARDAFSRRAQDLIESACNVRMGLDECNQPDILSPLRDGVRNLKISKHPPSCFTPQDPLELSAQSTREQNTTNSAELLEGFSGSSLPGPLSSPQIPKRSVSFSERASERADLHPLIRELITATKTHDITKLNGACSGLLELSSCCVDAAKEGLQVAKSPVLEKLLRYREMVELTPCLISLAKEVATNSTSNTEGLMQTANVLLQWICEARQCLTIVAGPWFSLAMQLVCTVSPCGFLDYTQTLDEIMEILVTVVQLVGKATHTGHSQNLPEFPGIHETCLRIQAKFTCVQARMKELLEKALSVHNAPSDQAKVESFNRSCILWSVTMKAFLNLVDQFIGRDILSLRGLKTKMKPQLCLQSTLAAVSESSLRIQEAARLSLQSCAEQSAKEELLALRERMKILTEALLQVAHVLSASPLPAPKLLTRFELLQTEFAVTAKLLLLQLGVVNREYFSSIQNVIRVSQPIDREGNSDIFNKEAFKQKAGQLLANVQKVKKIIGDAFENVSSFKPKESLLSTADHLLFLTEDLVGRAEKLPSQLDKEHLLTDWILHEWSAEAGYLVTQLQITKAVSETALEHIVRCLQNEEGHSCSSQAFCKMQPVQHKKGDSTGHQTSPTPRHRVTETGQEVLPAVDAKEMHGEGLQSSYQSSRNSTGSPTESLGDPEKWWSSGCPVSQATKEMTTHMSHMAQFLKRKGPITTKEQLIACATRVIDGAQALVKFAGIIAKNCLDERCASELLNAMEQTKTISYQLSIISRVNASTGRSRSSAEHLVSNAQSLTQAALQMLKAAEVASVKGLHQPPSSSEEADVSAFCSLWRKSLWWHRAKEVLHSDRDELGLRKTGMWIEPTFMSMIQEANQQSQIPFSMNTLENLRTLTS